MNSSAGRRATLFVIDDEPAIARMLVEALTRPDLDVVTATRGDRALEMYREDPAKFDLILMDLQMHPRDGLQILSELRRINPSVRVAFMTGSPSEYPVADILASGAVSVFAKPFVGISELTCALLELLNLQP